MTLHEALKSLGFTSRKEHDDQRRTIYDKQGQPQGSFTAEEAWAWLKARKESDALATIEQTCEELKLGPSTAVEAIQVCDFVTRSFEDSQGWKNLKCESPSRSNGANDRQQCQWPDCQCEERDLVDGMLDKFNDSVSLPTMRQRMRAALVYAALELLSDVTKIEWAIVNRSHWGSDEVNQMLAARYRALAREVQS